MRRKSFTEVLDQLVSSNRISATEADSLRDAPRISLDIRELINYLAALIVTVGVVRLVVVVFKDASSGAVIAALYLAALLLGVISFRLRLKRNWMSRLSEVLEVLSVLSAALASGVLFGKQLEWRGEYAAMIPAIAAGGWGVIRVRAAQFAAVAELIPSIIVIAATVSSLIDAEGPMSTLPVVIAGGLLVAIGTQEVSFPIAYRIVGAVILLGSSPNWVADRGSVGGLAVTLAIGAALFALGSTQMWLELLVVGSVIITIAVSVFIFQNVDNEILQGTSVVAVGLALIAVTTYVYGRGKRSRSMRTAMN